MAPPNEVTMKLIQTSKEQGPSLLIIIVQLMMAFCLQKLVQKNAIEESSSLKEQYAILNVVTLATRLITI